MGALFGQQSRTWAISGGGSYLLPCPQVSWPWCHRWAKVKGSYLVLPIQTSIYIPETPGEKRPAQFMG
nr:hypothetical protein pBo12 [Bovine gammaherpesvirus 4]